MTGIAPLSRWALLSAVPVILAAGRSWSGALVAGGLVGLGGMMLDHRLRSWFDGRVALLGTLALLTSLSLIGPEGDPDIVGALLFVASCAALHWAGASWNPGTTRLLVIAGLALAPAVHDGILASWRHIHPDNLLAALFAAQGLLYGAPLLWAGFAGLAGLRRGRPGLVRLAVAGILPGTLALLLVTSEGEASTRALAWLPFLTPGLAWSLDRALVFASRRPARVLAGGGALLVLWNLLFMEQYRLRLLPSDDTVAFAQVTSNSAGLVSRSVGTPVAWPANWIFAMRFGAPLDLWEGAGGRRLFASTTETSTTIEFGDDPSVFAADAALLLEGFGTRRTCEQGWCREVYGAGRVLLPLDDVGRGEFVVRLRARGEGALQMTLSDVATSVTELSESLSEVTLRVPARSLRPGIGILSLKVLGGERAALDRLTLERDLALESAR